MSIFNNPKYIATKQDGTPAAGFKVQFDASGTTTPKPVYSTFDDAAAQSNPLPNPVILDGNGEAEIWPEEGSYKETLLSNNNVVQPGWPIDNIDGSGQSLSPGENLTGSSSSDIILNINKFIVRGATGNTTIDGTLDVNSAMIAREGLVMDNNKAISGNDTLGGAKELLKMNDQDSVDVGDDAHFLIMRGNGARITTNLEVDDGITAGGDGVFTNVTGVTSVSTLGTCTALNFNSGDANFKYVQGSFEANWAGFTSTPTSTVHYTIMGDVVTLCFEKYSDTSDGTTLKITNLPAILQPPTYEFEGFTQLIENSLIVNENYFYQTFTPFDVWFSVSPTGTVGVGEVSIIYKLV